MSPLQIKVLKHIQDSLVSYNGYNPYRSLNDALESNNIQNGAQRDILKKTDEALKMESQKIALAIEWIRSLMDETK